MSLVKGASTLNGGVSLSKETFQEFKRHKAQWLAAAIAYFTIFAIAPLIIVIVEIAGIILGHHRAVLEEIYGYLQSTAGSGAASAVQSIVSATFNHGHSGALAQIIGWVLFFVATMGLFSALQEALNTVWDIEPKKESILALIRKRAISFGIIVLMALLLLSSLAINAILTTASHALAGVFPLFPTLMKGLDFVISFVVIATAFAFIFAFLPECRILWRDVWIGGAVTSFLFVIGQFLLGWYLGRAGITSGFGAFGSLIVFLVWTNYSAQIFLLGAEFTHVYARHYGSHKALETRAVA